MSRVWTLHALLPIFFFVLCSLLYFKLFGHDWTYDDWQVIVQNPDIRSFSNFIQDTYRERPLRELSFMLDRFLFGMEPRWWHIQNILWHSLNAFFVFILSRELTGRQSIGLFASLLFLVHPAHVEVVANLSHRKDSLSLVFCLISFISFIKACSITKYRRTFFLFSCVFWVIALSAKQNAIVLPFLFLIYVWFYVEGVQKISLRHKFCFTLFMFVGALTLYALFYDLLSVHSIDFYKLGIPLLEKYGYHGEPNFYIYYLMLIKSWAFVFSKIIWPFDLGVEYFYSVPESIFDPWVISGFFLVVFVVVGLWVSKKKSYIAFFSISWCVIFWLPTSNIWPSVYFAADRYLYAPSVGLFILFSYTIFNSKSCFIIRRYHLHYILLIPLCFISFVQNQNWESDETLYLHSLKISPRSAFICNELGKYYYEKKDFKSALRYFKQGELLDPQNASILYNLGNLYMSVNIIDKAEEYYCKFLNLDLPAEYIPFALNLKKKSYLNCTQ